MRLRQLPRRKHSAYDEVSQKRDKGENRSVNNVPAGQAYSNAITPELRDAGKRASDLINTYRAGMDWDELQTKWLAIRLADGGSDGVLYDSKKDAVKHQLHEQQCAYVAFRNLVAGSSARDMAIFLKFNRDAYASGMRLIDPDDAQGGRDLIMPAGAYDKYARQHNTADLMRAMNELAASNALRGLKLA